MVCSEGSIFEPYFSLYEMAKHLSKEAALSSYKFSMLAPVIKRRRVAPRL